MIIYNLVFLIIINTIFVNLPLPFISYLPLAFIQPLVFGNGSLYQMISLNRIHTQIEEKNAFKQAKKKYHPDKGGSAEEFALFQNMKSFININGTNYYDIYGIVQLKGEKKLDVEHQMNNKRLIIFVEIAMYYIMTLIFALSVTLSDQNKYLRKYIVLAMILIAGQQYLAYNYSTMNTLIDFIVPTMPLHLQFFCFNNILSCLIGMIRSIHNNKITRQKILIKNVYDAEKQNNNGKILEQLKQLDLMYTNKVNKRNEEQNSLFFKIKNYFAKGLSLLFFILMIKSFIE